jgi:aerobic-type carbon monoxide dehydrogenase small subunit (CoxS/CutS family)
MSIACRLNVNGTERNVEVDGTETLLTTLRDRLALLGAKRGCDQGVCGACTVLMDGLPVRACLSLAANCEGSALTTIEALSRDALGRDLQQAFVEVGAVQCGFCTAGMLLSAYALLRENPAPQLDDVRDALSGNLCRCSGYRKIIDAVLHVARKQSA